jgi:hypothetical protein
VGKSQLGWRMCFSEARQDHSGVHVVYVALHAVWRFQVGYISLHKVPECSAPRTDVIIHFRLQLARACQRHSHLGPRNCVGL